MAGRSSNKQRKNTEKDIDLKTYQETQSKLRWKDGEKGDLARDVMRFNRKRRRAIKAGIPESALPPVLWGKDLRDNVITTRRDLDFERAKIDRFMKADLSDFSKKNGRVVTEQMQKEAQYLLNRGNRAVARERARLEKLGVTSFGKPVGTTIGQMGDLTTEGYRAYKLRDLSEMEPAQRRDYIKSLERRAHPDYIPMKNYMMQRNYVVALFNTGGVNSYTLRIAEEILNLSPNDFVVEYYKERDTSRFDYRYDENMGTDDYRTAQTFAHYVGKGQQDYDIDDFDTERFDVDFGINMDGRFDKLYDFIDYYNDWKASKN